MLRGLPASIVFHAAVIAAGSIVLPSLERDISVAPIIVPIELVTVSDITNIAPQVERDAPDPEPETPPPLEEFLEDLDTIAPEEAEPEPPEDDPAAPPPPEPEPEPVIQPEPEEEAETPEPEPDQADDRPILDQTPEDPLANILGDADNLFDRTPRDNSPSSAPPPAPEVLEDETPNQGAGQRGAGDLSDRAAQVETFIVRQLSDVCWRDVKDLPDPERLIVSVRLRLKPNGTLAEDVKLVRPSRPPIGDRFMQQAIDRALNAARRCAPYNLPEGAEEYYEDWDDLVINFGPELSR
ncbi:MAG: cell envelope integrity protein TolA [Pseudomonadota bacterium]